MCMFFFCRVNVWAQIGRLQFEFIVLHSHSSILKEKRRSCLTLQVYQMRFSQTFKRKKKIVKTTLLTQTYKHRQICMS